MRAVLALLVLGSAAAIAFLISGAGGGRERAAPPARPPSLARPDPSAAPRVTPLPSPPAESPRAILEAPRAPVVAPEAPAVAVPDFDARFDERVRDGRKAAIRELLADWRTGRLTPEQDRRIDEALRALDEAEVVKAAGHVLFEGEPPAAQRDGLLALLAAAGSEDAADYLIAAAERANLRGEALAALATVADPRALPRFDAAASAGQDAEVLAAIAAALRNMETEKARALEARVRRALEGR